MKCSENLWERIWKNDVAIVLILTMRLPTETRIFFWRKFATLQTEALPYVGKSVRSSERQPSELQSTPAYPPVPLSANLAIRYERKSEHIAI